MKWRAPSRVLFLFALAAGLAAGVEWKVAPAAPDVLAVSTENGRAILNGLQPYAPQPNDLIVKAGLERYLVRNNQRVAGIAGAAPDRLFARFFDKVEKEFVDLSYFTEAKRWRVEMDGVPVDVLHVGQKSKPLDLRRTANWSFGTVDRHVFYLRLASALQDGAVYRVRLADGATVVDYTHRPAEAVAESLHGTHLGFRPDDPSKIAFASLWMGTAGRYDFAAAPSFSVVDEATAEVVLEGLGTRAKPQGEAGEDAYNLDHTKTETWLLDFSGLQKEGRYRIRWNGVGVSMPFEIGVEGTWQRAFRFAMRGLYHQRAGTALGEPFTAFNRPLNHHPDMGFTAYQSLQPFFVAGGSQPSQSEIFKLIVEKATGDVVPGVWGGYHDAGDWDTHAGHLRVPRCLMTLYELAPDYFKNIEWNIPVASPALPGLLEESLWTVEFFERLQMEDGAVRGGIEAEEHPVFPETSWLDSLRWMAFAPDMQSSWLFAASAAQGARLVAEFDPDRAARLGASAQKAFEWAEGQLAAYSGAALDISFNDARNLAAVQLWRMTGEARYHEIFEATTAFKAANRELDEWQKHNQPFAAVAYLLETAHGKDEGITANALAAVEKSARVRLEQSRRTNFRWTKHPWAPTGWGALGAPQAEYLVFAHKLTGKPEYLEGAIQAALQSLGANPSNMTYVTGLGHASPIQPLVVDPDTMAWPAPEGIVVYGPAQFSSSLPWSYTISPKLWNTVPDYKDWPTVESYINLGLRDPSTNEYTVHQTNNIAALVWGYLAARP